jgi:hypothetical protein
MKGGIEGWSLQTIHKKPILDECGHSLALNPCGNAKIRPEKYDVQPSNSSQLYLSA